MLTEPTESEEFLTGEQQPQPAAMWLLWLATAALIVLGVLAVLFLHLTTLNEPPADFPTNRLITVPEGATAREITELLAEEQVVRSATLLYYTLVLFHDATDVKASSYVFTEPLSTAAVATRLIEGDFDTNLIRFTHFEGERVELVARRAAEILPNFSRSTFLEQALPLEGRLWPDTYFIPPDYTEEDLLALLLETFTEQTNLLATQIDAHPLTLDEVLVLASIIEREANTPESMRLVSSVLQNRLEIGMALQADASIEYVLDKPLSELTPADLEIDSPYNTYLYPGLPPTPIGNPGLDAITAVLEPAESEYFYYITGNDGVFYFSETYDEHLRNIERHLR